MPVIARIGTSKRGLVVPVLAVLLGVACTDSDTVTEPDAAGGWASAGQHGIRAVIACTANTADRAITCAPPASPPEEAGLALVILGGQDEFVRLTSWNVSYDSATETFEAMVSVTNLIGQALGTPDGTSTTGVRVFFHDGPHVTAGAGSVTVGNADGTGTFTGSNQPYFEYSVTLQPNQESPGMLWQWSVPPTATTFAFQVLVDAEVEYPTGWVELDPTDATVEVGSSVALTATVRDVVGRPDSTAVDWSSSDPATAAVDAEGLVIGSCAGAATITATAPHAVASAAVAVVPVLETPPPETYLVWSPRIVASPTTSTVQLKVVTANTVPHAEVALASGGNVSMCRTGTHTHQYTFAAADALYDYATGDLHNFVGYLENVLSGRGNLFVNVKDVTVPDVAVTTLTPSAQHATHVANIRYDVVTRGSVLPSDVVRTFYDLFPDSYDFVAVVQPVTSFNNRYYSGVQNDTQGLGLSLFDRSAQYGSAGRLQGIVLFPVSSYFDLGETAASHEIGHRWINFLDSPLLASGEPHWPISSLARGLMGFNIPGSNVGGTFSYVLHEQPSGDYLLECADPIREYLDFDLYLMGLIPPDSVGEHFVFTNQNQGSSVRCGGTLLGPVQRFGVADVIATDGARFPAWPTAQRDFRIATIVVSRGRLLTEDEMAFFDHMAARGSATTQLHFTSGFTRGMTKPFYVSTGGRGTLTTTLQ
jgi:hypothetical protein